MLHTIFKSILIFLVIVTSSSASSAVGNLKGSASVGQGLLHYDIDILTPPGIAGVAPDLSFSYTQNSGSGFMGDGWHIGGVSVITRCGSTVAQDGHNSGLKYDNSDNYCLDGQRLIAIHGAKGESGTEYRTEIDTFSKIVSYGSNGNGPARFEVYTKSGDIYEYGATRDSKVSVSDGTVYKWMVSSVSDHLDNDNKIYFSYNDQKAIQEIRYALGENRVVFNYSENRLDKARFYVRGKVFKRTKELQKVSIYAYDNNIRNYHLAYLPQNAATDKLKLASLQECDRGECLEPITFDYGSDLNGQHNIALNINSRNVKTGDFNNDGITDLYVLDGDGNHDIVRFGSSDGQFSGGTVKTGLSLSSSIFFVDINGDGYLDIYELHKKHHDYRLGDGKGHFGSAVRLPSLLWGRNMDNIKFADFNGDGKVDIFYKTTKRPGGFGDYLQAFYIISPLDSSVREITLGTPKTISFYGYDEGYDDLKIADVNNDGLPDVLNDTTIWINNGNFQFKSAGALYPANGYKTYYLHDIQFADLNGDGYIDIYETHYRNDDLIRINDGTGNFTKYTFSVDYANHKSDLVFADFNQDGFTDIYNQKSKKLWLNTAQWFDDWNDKFNPDYSFAAETGTKNTLLGDFNGDGSVDILDADKKKLWLNRTHREFLTSVTDSFGNKTEISYKPLTDTGVYTKGGSARYPAVDYGSSAYVVSGIQTRFQENIVEKLSYRYYQMKADLRGRGSLGFGRIITTDHIQGRTEEVYYSQQYPFTGKVISRNTKLTDGTSISSARYTYEQTGNRVKQVLLKKSLEIDNLHNINTINNYSMYDPYGNVLRLSTKTVNTMTGESFIKTTSSTYDNDPQRWILARLLSSQVEHEGGDVDTYMTKSSEFTYNEEGLLESETIKGDDKTLTKTYTYDDYGNKTKESISGSDIESRSTKFIYDKDSHFLVKVEKPLGMSESYTYDKSLGKILTSVSNDNPHLKTVYHYDPFGKPLLKSVPGAGKVTYTYRWDKNAPSSLYSVTVTAEGSAPVTTWYDSFDRKVRVQKIGFDGRKIYEDSYYNAKGEVYKATVPYFSGDDIAWVRYEYDKFGRPLSTREPSPQAGEKRTEIAYDGLTTTTTNAKGQTKKVTKNVLGKVKEVTDPDGNVIRYEYDAMGNLRFTSNGNDQTIEIEYDAFGNKKYMSDPDLGKWHYRYDVLGQLLSQTDAKGQTTTLHYDKLGRLTAKDSGNEHFSWIYDTLFKGKLTEEKNSRGFSRKYRYDSYGRVTEKTTRIDGKSYSEKYQYDKTGRMVAVTEPQKFTVLRDYNDYGYLTSIKTPVGSIEQMSEERMKELTDKALKSINDYRDKAADYLKKAQDLSQKANYYAALAKRYQNVVDYAKRLKSYAKKLRSYAAYYQRIAIRYNSYARQYQKKSEHYYSIAKRHWWAGWARWYAARYAAYTRRAIAIAKRYASYARKYYRYANWYDSYANSIDKYYSKKADYYLKEAKKLAIEAKAMTMKAKSYSQMAQSIQQASSAYQEMMDDRDYTYFYKVLAKDALGRTTAYLDGNGLINQTHYDTSGVINYMTTGFGGDAYLRNISYTYDDLGNVLTRVDEALGINQEFEYDNLNRVVSAQTGGNRLYLKPMQYEYDTNGNILYKSDVGSYEYNNPDHIHAVTKAGNRHFAYDANGNMVDNNGMKISYDRFNKPVAIRTNGTSVQFAYDPEGNRYKKSTGSYETHYLGKSYEHIRYNDGREQEKYYIYADGKVQAIHTNGSDDIFETRYLHYDALGSVDTVTDMNGFAIQRAVYKPFGEKIVVDNEGNRVTAPAYTHRGYTGHEEIEETDNLIHMNGRVYDSKIARFISADPHIQAPQDTQSYNRYSYVKNNPLKYTDPSGYFFSGLKKWASRHWKAIVTTVATVAVGVLTGGLGLGLGVVAQGAAIGFTAGAVGTLVNGGSVGNALRNGIIGGLFGAVGAGLSYGIGSGINSFAGRALAHGALNSFMARARGGRWNSGFWAGFAGTMLSPVAGSARGYYAKIATNAFVAGTVSQITGGKFANGAWSGAFRFMFNDWLHDLANFSAGFGDSVTFGATSKLRQWLDWDENVEYESGYYTAGEVSGVIASAATVWTGGLYGGARSVFWSGYKQGAQELAQPLGITIEKTLIGGLANGRIKSEYFWKAASWTFVRNARGPVSAVIRAEGTVWSTIEKPYLMKQNIKINYH